MKRRTFISLAGLASALGLPLVGKTAQNYILTGSTSPISNGPPLRKQDRRVIIKVVGVGGAGINVVKHIVRHGVQGVECVCFDINTRSRETFYSTTPMFLRGLPGVHIDCDPIFCKETALSKRFQIAKLLNDAHMVVITAGMGGGTGTGVSAVVAKVARNLGIPTVAVVTTPFAFEGKRVRRAQEGLLELDRNVDSLYILSNEKLMENLGDDVTLSAAFHFSDEVIKDTIEDILIASTDMPRTRL